VVVENHLAARKKVVLEDVKILTVLHRLEEVVILEAEGLTDVLQKDPIEILAEGIENLLADSEENVEKAKNSKHKKYRVILFSSKPMIVNFYKNQ
jgi:hypothetical protein